MKDLTETGLFIVHFSTSKGMAKNFKFSDAEKQEILSVVSKTEEVAIDLFKLGRSQTDKTGLQYRVPIILEKWKKETFDNKYPNRFASCTLLKFGTVYNKININNNSTFLICLSPDYKTDIVTTISHELFHALFICFEEGRLNSDNKELLDESLAVLFSHITKG